VGKSAKEVRVGVGVEIGETGTIIVARAGGIIIIIIIIMNLLLLLPRGGQGNGHDRDLDLARVVQIVKILGIGDLVRNVLIVREKVTENDARGGKRRRKEKPK
jgi:hypothetical protein